MWLKLKQFALALLLVNSVASANDISQLDGDWYSFKWKYGYSLSNGKGVAFATNSPNFKVGQEIVRLTAVGKNSFVGENVYKDGKFYKVKATLDQDGKLLFEGEKNVKWEMERIDPETYSSIVNSKPDKQAKKKENEDLKQTPKTSSAALTGPQKNAVRQAKQYLSFKGFSREGLIHQLTFNGFDEADSAVALDSMNIDWSEQAARAAKSYLDLMGFSCSGLVQQLNSVAEKFTLDQARYGAQKAGGC